MQKGTLVVEGTSVLTPYSVLSPTGMSGVNDFKQIMIGLVEDPPKDGKYLNTQAMVYGYTSYIAFGVLPIIMGSPGTLVQGQRAYFQYRDAKIIDMNIEVLPTGNRAERMGEWIMTLSYRDPGRDIDLMKGGDNLIPLWNATHKTFLSVTGPGSSSLSLDLKPKPSDGWIYQFNPSWASLLELSINYRCPNRDVYNVRPTECGYAVRISGKVEMRTCSSSGEVIAITPRCRDYLAKVSLAIRHQEHMYAIASGAVIENKDRYIMFSGDILAATQDTRVRQ